MKHLGILGLVLILLLSTGAPQTTRVSAFAGTIPTFSVIDVNPDKDITIRTNNFPANDTFAVLMGKFGTKGVNGIRVATQNSGKGGTFTAKYQIPDELKGLALIAVRLQSTTGSGYFSYNWFSNNTTGAGTGGIPVTGYAGFPTFSIVSVEPDKTVTIQTSNLPPKDTFTVYMGKIGTKAIGGIKVGTFDSDNDKVQKLTFNIPDDLKGRSQIAIRFQSPTTGYFAYNWFLNSTTEAGTGGIPVTGYTGFPTFAILSVDPGKSVTIQAFNLPPSDEFVVRMATFGKQAIGGTKAGTFKSNEGGKKKLTFDIPDNLKDESRIAIRFDSPTSGYFAYNWFWNTSSGTSGTGGIPVTGYKGFPTFSILSVERNKTVTIQTKNLPPNDSFTVYMGVMGSRAIGGIKVGSFKSDTDPKQKLTFDIPDALKGSTRIAIRFQSPTTGFFAYNWFWNNNAP